MDVIVLDATTKKLTGKLAGEHTTTAPVFTAHYSDVSTSFVEGSSDGVFNGTNSVDIVTAPATSTRRLIKSVSVHNADTVTHTVSIIINNNSTERLVFKSILGAGRTWDLNIGVAPSGTEAVLGTSRTAGYLPKFDDAEKISNSPVYTDGTRVGIGTSSPAYKLDIYDGSVNVSRANNADGRSIDFSPAGPLSASNRLFAVGLQGGANEFHIATWDGSNFNRRLIITNNGDVYTQKGTWTPSFTGFSSNPSGPICRYVLIGKLCTVFVTMPSAGTSNSSAFSMTLPFTSANISNAWWSSVGYGVNNGSAITNGCFALVTSNSSTCNLYVGPNQGSWTASGSKQANFTLTYEIA